MEEGRTQCDIIVVAVLITLESGIYEEERDRQRVYVCIVITKDS